MAGKPPYFPFYVRDFASDGKVEAMSTEEVGAYVLLLCKAWLEEPPGSIPADDAILARWARLDADTWSKCRARILSPFTLETSSNRYFQKRMQEEFRKLMGLYRARSAGGRKGASKRWQKEEETDPEPLVTESWVSHSSPNGKNMAPDSDSVSDSGFSSGEGGAGEGEISAGRQRGRASDALDPEFDRFWRLYPRKQALMAARIAWDALNPDADLVATILRAVAAQRQSEQWRQGILPLACNWLEGCRWQDEFAAAEEPKESLDERIARKLAAKAAEGKGS